MKLELQALSLQWVSNVFAPLVKRPVEYFEKRHLGDIVSRPDGHCTLRRLAVRQFLAEGKEVEPYESQSLSANTENFGNHFHDNENQQHE